MRTWRPDPMQSLTDRSELAAYTIGSIRDALSCLPTEIADPIDLILSVPDAENVVFHSDIFGWYFAILRQIQKEDHRAVLQAAADWRKAFNSAQESRARALSNSWVFGATVDVAAGEQGNDALMRAVEAKKISTGLDAHITPVTEFSGAKLENIRAAFALIDEIWPEALAEIRETLQRIYFFDSQDFISFTDFDTHGAVFIRQDFIDDPCRLAEEILHESSHIHLNTILAVTPLFLNTSDERYTSPLRADPRPMYGVFHQMYVLSRLAHFCGLMADREPYASKATLYRSQLRDAAVVVRNHGRLTEAGAELAGSILAALDPNS